MYQSLLAKKKETEQLNKAISDLHHEASKQKTDSDRAQAKLIYERETLDDECKSLKSSIEIMKNEQTKLRENNSNILNDNKRLKSDIDQLETRVAALRKENDSQCTSRSPSPSQRRTRNHPHEQEQNHQRLGKESLRLPRSS